MKTSKVILNIMSVVCFIYGALYIFSLVFIPVGIYCFIAGRRFSYKAEHLQDVFFMNNIIFRNYVIFASILCFPFGLLSIIPYYILTSNKISVQNVEDQNSAEPVEIKTEEVKIEETASTNTEETLTEKKEKFEKLKKFNEKGLITDDELEQARVQLFGKEDK